MLKQGLEYKYYITPILTIDEIYIHNEGIASLKAAHNLFDTEADARKALGELKIYIASKK